MSVCMSVLMSDILGLKRYLAGLYQLDPCGGQCGWRAAGRIASRQHRVEMGVFGPGAHVRAGGDGCGAGT